MKKVLFVLPFALLLGACGKQGEQLPEPEAESKSVKLTKANCGLTTDDSTEAFVTALDIEGTDKKYEFEIGPNCYAHSKWEEFLVKKDGYIKSKSTYKVDRLVIDYMSKNLITFEVHDAEGNAVTPHESSVQTEYPGESDYGAVAEFPINGNAWSINNVSEYKPAFYSVTVIFTM